MSAAVDAAPRTAVRAGGPPVWAVLGRSELRRLVLHPVFLGSLAFTAVTAGLEGAPGPRPAYGIITAAGIFFVGPFAFFAANLLATRDRRHRAEEWLDSLPAARRDRTAAALVACAGPAVVGAVIALGLFVWFAAAGLLVRNPPVLELLSIPLSVLGGGLLGVMVARWARFPGAALLVMVGLVAFHMRVGEHWPLLGAYVEFARWGDTTNEWAGVIDGSRGWHAVYLVGLCAMAAIGALLVDARRKVLVVLLGVAVTAVTALAGWAQLP
jgi:hypothetical protein